LELKQEMEKASKYLKKEEKETKDSSNNQEKKGFLVDIDWNYYLDMLLVEIYIEIENYDKAE
jgi:hypothetical protein